MPVVRTLMRPVVITCLLFLGYVGCDDDSSSNKDAGLDSSHQDIEDSDIMGDADLVEDGSVIARCGLKGECEPDEFCVYPNCHLCADESAATEIVCPAPYCLKVKDSNCNSCNSCYEGNPCKSWGTCQRVLSERVICGCPRINVD